MTYSWETPAQQLGKASDQSAASAWYNWGTISAWKGDYSHRGKLGIPYMDWTWPIYDATKANTTRKVWRAVNGYVGTGVIDGGIIPWNTDWKPGTNSDAGILIDNKDGTGWEIWKLYPQPTVWDFLVPEWWKGWRKPDLIVGVINFRSLNTIGKYNGRGAGAIPKKAGIVTASEVASGVIPHAIAAVGFNHQQGPGATFVAPGTRVEHVNGQPCGSTLPNGIDPRLIPEGSRFALNITDTEIEKWASKYAGVLKSTAITFARCLRDYGWMSVETGCGEPQIETTGSVGPDAALWTSLGITSAAIGMTLLDGLITASNIYVVNPA